MGKIVGLLTGGGDCPGLNPALRGVVMRGLDHGFEFVGFLEGWRGLVEGNIQPVTPTENIIAMYETAFAEGRY